MGPTQTREGPPQKSTALIAALVFCSLLGVGWWGLDTAIKRKPTALELLVESAGPFRWSELRVEGFPYAPFDPGADTSPPEPFELLGSIYSRISEGDETANRSLVLFYLWRNHLGDVNRALDILGRDPEGAERWNLEAVAHVVAGDLIHALEKVERAFEEDSSSELTLFNRAVVMGMLPLREAPRKAWGLFQEIAVDSPWAAEGRERLAAIDKEEPLPPDLGEARADLKEKILGLGDAAALQALLADVDSLALLENLSEKKDTFLAKGIAFRERLSVIEWARVVREAKQLDAAIDMAVAGEKVHDELERLAGSRDPLVSVGALRGLAYLDIVGGNSEAARKWLHRILDVCSRLGCQEEAILAGSDLGTVELERGDFRAAQSALDEAMERLAVGFEFRRAELLTKRSYLTILLGAPRQGLQHAVEAASSHQRLGRKDGVAVALTNLAVSLRRQKLLRASAVLASEAAHAATQAGVVSEEVTTKASYGLNLVKLGRVEEGREQVALAISMGRKARLGTSLVLALRMAAWTSLEEGDSDLAHQHATEAVELARVLGLGEPEFWSLHVAAVASFAQGNPAGAAALLTRAVSVASGSVEQTPFPLAKARREAGAAHVYGFLGKVEAMLGRQQEAWMALGGNEVRPLEGDECRIAYVETGPSSVGIWSATKEKYHFEEKLDVEKGDLGSPWEEGRCPIETRRLTVLENSFTLTGIGAPTSRAVRPEVPVVIARTTAQLWPDWKVAGPALATHSPRPLNSEEPLPGLPGAREEARILLEAFPGSRELKTTEATPVGVASAIVGYGLLHFGVHAESRIGAGAASFLRLAGENGLLQVVDVLDLSLKNRRPLVVLSACQVGGEVGERESDGAGLPWAFLEAGASAVIATSKKLDDRAAVDFSQTFYGALSKGAGASEAFEEALQALRAKWPPEVAASFAFYI